jgi:hypothetical protein
MTATPPPSPWPAPTLPYLPPANRPPAPLDPGLQEPDSPSQSRRAAAALLVTAKRLSSRSERAQHAAVKEEQRISGELRDLPAGWFVLASLDIVESSEAGGPDREADHIAVGPGGVFIIYLDHQLGAKVWISEHKVTINGRDNDHVRRARFEARHANGSLSQLFGFDVAVQSVLVLIGAATIQMLSHPAEVHVRNQHDLRDWLCRQPVRLDPDQVTALRERFLPAGTSPSDSMHALLE